MSGKRAPTRASFRARLKIDLGTREGWARAVALYGAAFILLRCQRNERGCAIWQGAVNGIGYGVVKFFGKAMYAHRVSLFLARGPLPKNRLACHTCDERLCCEPTHLYAGTHSSNLAEAWARNRRTKPSTLAVA